VTRQLALHLAARGHHAEVVTNLWPAGTAARETLDGVPVTRLPLVLPEHSPRGGGRFAAVAPRSAVRLARLTGRFDVLHVIGAGPNAAYAAALRRLLGARIVLTLQGEFRADAHRAFERSRSLRFGLRQLLASADAVTACSRFVLDELSAGGLDVRAGAEVIPNGVNPNEFDRGAQAGYILAAGRLVEQKGLDTLLRAYAAACPELGGRRLVLAGDGPERERLEGLADSLGLDGNVSFLGSVGRERVAELLSGADLFAFPSRYEAFGVALLEAMAAGVPVVAAHAGGIPEFAVDGENALLVPPDDEPALARALTRLAQDDELARRLVAGGRAQAERHSWDAVATRYEEVYRRVLA
jgi:glycosyltransferase involved in cell wall biosynthesis